MVSVAVKVTTPLALEGPLAAEMIELSDPLLNVTVLPDTGLPAPSFKVTVMVDVAMPFARTGVVAVTVESVGLIAVTVKLAVEVIDDVLVAVLL
jgi:hypothetical protein